MRTRKAALLAVAPIAFLVPGVLAAEKPTPVPTAKATRKLGGGSFGQPPNPAPTPAAKDASSLADIARKTQENAAPTAQTTGPSIVITNESLRKPEPGPAGASVSITGSAGSKPVVRVPPSPAPTVGPPPEYKDAKGMTEADWRERTSTARRNVEKAEADLVVAQEEARRLENDFYAWSDGNYRERVIRPAWDQARERIKLLEDRVLKAREHIGTLEDEARQAGTPPGWLR